MSEVEVKDQVRQFYDQIGWQTISEGVYQNARYEDLRPVSQEYIRRCHLRVNRSLKPEGHFLLDAGSGPIQYPEYLTYSQDYRYRICLDVSRVALLEARKRIGEHGLFVVADVANIPFKPDVFEGVVSLHTLHHLPSNDKKKAYEEIYRVLSQGCSAVVVNGWTDSPLMRRSQWLLNWMERSAYWLARLRGIKKQPDSSTSSEIVHSEVNNPTGTFINKLDAAWVRRELSGKMDFEILVWRSVSVRFLRAIIHRQTGGRYWLRVLYWLEECFPYFFGENGQYPLIVIYKEE